MGVGDQLRGRLRVWRVAGVLDRVCCRTCGWLRWWGEPAPGVAGANKGSGASHALRDCGDCMASEAGRGGDGRDALTAALGVIGNPSNWDTKLTDSALIKCVRKVIDGGAGSRGLGWWLVARLAGAGWSGVRVDGVGEAGRDASVVAEDEGARCEVSR